MSNSFFKFFVSVLVLCYQAITDYNGPFGVLRRYVMEPSSCTAVCFVTFPLRTLICRAEPRSSTQTESVHAGGQGGSNKQRAEEENFQHKTTQNRKKETSADTGSTLDPSNLLCSQLPAPAISRGATGGHTGTSFTPLAPFLATAFKVLHCDVHGLDVCLVPYMQSYHYPCLLTIAAPSLLHLQLFALGYDMTTVDLSSFTYRSPCLSFSPFLSPPDLVPCLSLTLI